MRREGVGGSLFPTGPWQRRDGASVGGHLETEPGRRGSSERPVELRWPDKFLGSLVMWTLTVGPPRPKLKLPVAVWLWLKPSHTVRLSGIALLNSGFCISQVTLLFLYLKGWEDCIIVYQTGTFLGIKGAQVSQACTGETCTLVSPAEGQRGFLTTLWTHWPKMTHYSVAVVWKGPRPFKRREKVWSGAFCKMPVPTRELCSNLGF